VLKLQTFQYKRCGPRNQCICSTQNRMPAPPTLGFYVSRQNAVSVVAVLVVEQFPGRHTDDTRSDTFLTQLLIGLQAKCNLAARADEDDLGSAPGASART
jgi:hypothetical protein